MKKTKEQRRAELALEAVRGCPKDKKDNLKTQAKKLPERIITAGLPGAIAFLEAKKGKNEGSPQLIEALKKVVNEFVPGGKGSLIERLASEDEFFQHRATDEVMAYGIWLKRFVDADI